MGGNNKQARKVEALIYVDYSESYDNTVTHKIQSAYFGQQNLSIFTSCP